MGAIFNPDNGWEVALLAFMSLGGLLGAIYPFWAKLKKIDGQVSNTHDTNLRDDVDSIKGDISDLKEIMLNNFHQLNEALNLERRERIRGDERNAA